MASRIGALLWITLPHMVAIWKMEQNAPMQRQNERGEPKFANDFSALLSESCLNLGFWVGPRRGVREWTLDHHG
jgi:hypothetical protein